MECSPWETTFSSAT